VDLIVEDDIEQGAVNIEPSVIFDETEPAKFVHEKADSGSSSADHLRQCLLADFGNYLLRLSLLPEIRQQRERPGEPLLNWS
jgi:hypothetical protein